jgi:hypothetical protein
MSTWTHGAQASKMSHFATTRTLSDFPLPIGEMLRRGNLLLVRACLQPIRAPDQFEGNSLPCFYVARAIRLRCTS